MAGTATVTTAEVARKGASYSVAWTATAGGAVSGNSFDVRGGELLSVETIPSVVTAPTAGYSLTLLDPNGVDLLSSRAVSLAAATSEIFQFDPPLYIPAEALDVVISAAGNAGKGTVVILMR